MVFFFFPGPLESVSVQFMLILETGKKRKCDYICNDIWDVLNLGKVSNRN